MYMYINNCGTYMYTYVHVDGLLKLVIHYKKKRACGRCSGCLKDDCEEFPFCNVKPKFGGPEWKKKRELCKR